MEKRDIKEFIRGTAIKITVVLNISTATSASITIDDPSNTEVVSSATMIKEVDTVYTYIFQSTTSNTEGPYIVTTSIVSGDYTSVEQSYFNLKKQEGSE